MKQWKSSTSKHFSKKKHLLDYTTTEEEKTNKVDLTSPKLIFLLSTFALLYFPIWNLALVFSRVNNRRLVKKIDRLKGFDSKSKKQWFSTCGNEKYQKLSTTKGTLVFSYLFMILKFMQKHIYRESRLLWPRFIYLSIISKFRRLMLSFV